MRSPSHFSSLLVGVALLAGTARAAPDDAERDQLLDRIIRGQDYAASVKRFAVLVRQRDAVVATTAAARDRERAEAQDRSRYHKDITATIDYKAAHHCNFSVDPTHPTITHEQNYSYHADWGKVVRKERVRLTPKDALDPGEPATLVEVAGQRRRYQLHVERLARSNPLVAEVGDLVLVCEPLAPDARPYWDKRRPDPVYPAGWTNMQYSAFTARISAPPLIARKARWNPIHVSSTTLFWAVRRVQWRYPDRFVLAHAQVERDLGGGRWEIVGDQKTNWILEVPPSLAGRELLRPWRYVWVIAGHQRFDAQLGKMVLVAEDLEERYLRE